MSDTHNAIDLEPELEAKLVPLAARSVLHRHADEQERLTAEYTEDDIRWERYLATGESVPAEVVLRELDDMAAEAKRLQKD